MDDAFWVEMNRREKWDRDHEAQLRTYRNCHFLTDKAETELMELERGMEQEDKARHEWDLKYTSLP